MRSFFSGSKGAYIPLKNVDERGEVVDLDAQKHDER